MLGFRMLMPEGNTFLDWTIGETNGACGIVIHKNVGVLDMKVCVLLLIF